MNDEIKDLDELIDHVEFIYKFISKNVGNYLNYLKGKHDYKNE